jgi:pyruvate/2-oxoglutarate dehydrogenase complex dihydrolipoamide dehydrogenase (E3) component
VDEIRRCIGINQGCLNRISRGFEISCTQNAAVGREREWGIGTLVAVDQPKKVVVVGGGPAGLKAADIAARRGHNVVLMERSESLGGQVRFASRLPLRDEWAFMIDNLDKSARRAGVDVRLRTEATAGSIAAERPDEVVVATGSYFAKTGYTPALGDRPSIPGEFEPIDPIDAINEPARCGKRVLIVDDKGDYLPLGLAHLLADAGHTVEVVSRQMFLGSGISFTGDIPWIYSALADRKVTLTPQTLVDSASTGEVVVLNAWTGDRQSRAVDSVILCMGKLADNALYAELTGNGAAAVRRIGDCVAPRGVDEAIFEGERAGRAV